MLIAFDPIALTSPLLNQKCHLSKRKVSTFHVFEPAVKFRINLLVLDFSLPSLDHLEARHKSHLELQNLRVLKDLTLLITVITSYDHFLGWRFNGSLLCYFQFFLILVFLKKELLLHNFFLF